MSWYRLAPLLLFLAAFSACAATDTTIPPLRDLRADAAEARASGRPIVLFFHSRTCPYCRQVEEDYLRWEMAVFARAPRIQLRAVDIHGDARLIGLDGTETTARAYAASRGVRFVPHLSFIGPEGQKLSDDLIGLSIPDFYSGFLEDAIRESVERLKSTKK